MARIPVVTAVLSAPRGESRGYLGTVPTLV